MCRRFAQIQETRIRARATSIVPDNTVFHGRKERDGDVQSARTPDVCILWQILVPQVEVEVLRVIQTTQQAPALEVVDTLAPVLAAPVVGVQAAGERHGGEATGRRCEELDAVNVEIFIHVVAHADCEHPQLST